MISISTGLLTAILQDTSLLRVMERGIIHVYSGPQPGSANEPVTGTLLGEITNNGVPSLVGSAVGLLLEPDGVAAIKHRGSWGLRGIASGVPGWWRFKADITDTNEFSYLMSRIDGGFSDDVLLAPSVISMNTTIPDVQFNLRFIGA